MSFLKKIQVGWEATALAEWSVDFTLLQTLLLLLTGIGGLFGSKLLIALGVTLLVLFSLPFLLGFDWELTLPAVILGCLGVYFQKR